jgi:RNA polymerase sigma factor (sigma-70 family)
MSSSKNPFVALLEQARSGCPEAARTLYDRYAHHVLRIVRRHLHPQSRAALDSTDLCQEVWQVFFHSLLAQQTFATADDLIRFLAGVARHKTQSANRHLEADKRAQGRTRYLGEHQLHELPDPRGAVPGADGTAEWQHLRQRLPLAWRRVYDLLREGYSQGEVASCLGVSRRTVRRVLERSRHLIQEQEPEVVSFRNPQRVPGGSLTTPDEEDGFSRDA